MPAQTKPAEYGGLTYKNPGTGQIPGGSGSDIAAPAQGDTDGGLSAGVLHTKQQEQNIRDKAIGGGVITNDDFHDYLGHFANDSVLKKGHNVGYKKKGSHAAVTGTALKGYRKLPGTGANQIGHARFGHADTGLPPSAPEKSRMADHSRMLKRMMKGGQDTAVLPVASRTRDNVINGGNSMPPTAPDKKMSIRHHEDSIKFNMRHAKDHEAAAKKHRAELKAVRKTKPPKR